MKTQKGYGIIRERSDDMARKTHTSTEVKQRWIAKAYKRYNINLRYDTDQELIDWIEKRRKTENTTAVFREALEEYIKGKPSE